MNNKHAKIVAILTVLALIVSLFAVLPAVAEAESEFSNDSVSFMSKINVGWDLGNSLDSWPGGSETAWGNPTITKQLITAVKTKGFNAIRLPVTWYQTIGAAPNYTITASYLQRVKQVVDYAVDNDMYIILNMHHEGDWLKPIIYKSDGVTEDTDAYNKMIQKYNAAWTQIANTFKNYNEKLIFECHNELRDGNNWGGYQDVWSSICNINKNFVSTVRATGGNNAKRYLIIKGYAAGTGKQMIDEFEIPADPANHLIFSFHSYSPSGFCFPPSTSGVADATTFDEATWTKSMTTVLKRVKTKFIDNGIAVICGEMGSVNKNNTAERVKHATAFVDLSANYGVKCFWWDNNGFTYSSSSESFGLINRSTYAWTYGAVADALINTGNKYVGFIPAAATTTATTATTTTTKPTTATTATTILTTPTTVTTTKPTTTQKPVIYGDLNSDNVVNSKDVLLLRKHLASMTVTIDEKAADVNRDGNINSKDLLLIRKFLAGIITQL